ncbi:Nn.00g067060.m01.CDS01 [Neocucurbitaria sp. VM-36]
MAFASVETLPAPVDLNYHYYPPSLAAKYGIPQFFIDHVGAKISEKNDVNWQPDFSLYETRKQQAQCAKKHEFPLHLPAHLDFPLAWKGQEIQDSSTYTHVLTNSELEEIERALAQVKENGISFSAVDTHNFVLQGLGPVLMKLSVKLHQGIGFFVLKGLEPATYSREDNIIIYLGVSSYIGSRRGRVNPRGDMISHIVQAPKEQAEKWLVGPAFGNSAQPFHADIGADILALYYLRTAAKGGRTIVASAWTVYNELAQTRPEVLVELAGEEWVHHTFGHYPPFFKRPLLFLADGKPILNFSRRVITGNAASPRDPRAPPVTRAQLDAMDAVHFTAEKYCLKLEQHEGDMLFVNNLAMLHSREAFEDDDNTQRHLLRLWLRNDELGWKIPDGLQLEWDNLFEPAEEILEKWNPRPPFLDPRPAAPRTSKTFLEIDVLRLSFDMMQLLLCYESVILGTFGVPFSRLSREAEHPRSTFEYRDPVDDSDALSNKPYDV